MGGHRAAMIGGGIWNLFRFAVVSLLVMRVMPQDPIAHINLLWMGGPGILVVGIFVACAFISGSARYYLPLLRIGMLVTAVTDVAVVLTGSYIPISERVGTVSDPISPLIFIIVYGILAVDLLILAALISYRPMDARRARPSDHDRPVYEATDVEEE
ncbi:MAG: hypothetical protein ACOC1I_00025 [Spirochaetota bacterium]